MWRVQKDFRRLELGKKRLASLRVKVGLDALMGFCAGVRGVRGPSEWPIGRVEFFSEV